MTLKFPGFIFCIVLACSLQGQAQSILFCGGVENNLPVGVSDRYYPDSAGTFLYAYYAQQTPLAMKQVGMELYKKNGETFEIVQQKQLYTVKPKWKYTYVKCYFTAPGLYKVKLYDESANLLGEGLITIL
jgi:hypothetical protein